MFPHAGSGAPTCLLGCSQIQTSSCGPIRKLSKKKKIPLGKLTNKNKIKIRKGRIEIEKRGGN